MVKNENKNISNSANYDAASVLDFSEFEKLNFKPVKSKQEGRVSTDGILLTIVNTENHGKRITFARELIDIIGSPSEIQVLINADGICISKVLPENSDYFVLKKSGMKSVLYSKQLIDEITLMHDLDFSNRSSISFSNMKKYYDSIGNLIAVVTLKDIEQQIAAKLLPGKLATEEITGPEQTEAAVDTASELLTTEELTDSEQTYASSDLLAVEEVVISVQPEAEILPEHQATDHVQVAELFSRSSRNKIRPSKK